MAMHHTDNSESSALEYFKFSLVILSILGFTALLASDGLEEYMRIFMGVFMITFAGFKLIGYKMFVMMFLSYDIIAKKFKAYAYAFPFIELGLGLMSLADVSPTIRSVLIILVMGLGSIGVFKEVFINRSGIKCACLGNIIKLPLYTVSLVEDISMVAMALTMLVL